MVPVDYTLKKYVRRPKGSPSGAALYQNEKTLYVNPKDAR
jgi:predicted ribosome quality control (RQC) complex YloA/Tae2 family protein